MDDVAKAMRICSDFMLQELRLAHIDLNLAENPLTDAEMTSRHSRHAGRILKTVNRLLAQGKYDRECQDEIVAERNRLHDRLSKRR